MEWIEVESVGIYSSILGMDPHADWLLGPGRRDFLPFGDDVPIPFLIAFHDVKARESFKTLLARRSRKGEPRPPIYIPKHYDLDAGGYLIGFTPKAFFDKLATEGGPFGALRKAQKQIKLSTPLRPASSREGTSDEFKPAPEDPEIGPPEGGWDEGTVFIGVFDDGIPFAHERFRNAGGTRIQCFWRQDPPPTGVEILKGNDGGGPGIDELLATCKTAGSIDEDKIYRLTRLIDFAEPGHKAASWRIAHGAHVLDLAAGADPAADIRNRPIICVQPPIAATQDSSGSDLDVHLLHGVDYILRRADALAGDDAPLPVVINCSYGLVAGPHDGSSPIEHALDELVAARGGKLRIVLPAGNSHLSRCHAEVKFEKDGPQTVSLRWRVQPDDQTPSSVELWLPHRAVQPAPPRLELSIVTPGGLESPPFDETHGAGVHLIDKGEVLCAAYYQSVPAPTERGVFIIKLQPTARLRPTKPASLANRVAPSGTWTIKLHNLSLGEDEAVHAWVQRDDTIYGYPRRGRQSWFDDPCYERFDAQGKEIEEDADQSKPCHVKRAGLVNSIATGAETIVAGGFRRRDLRMAKYSAGEPITPARGGTPNANYRKPDATLPSDDSRAHAGVLAAGSRSGSVVAMDGTSVAAPQLARRIANQLAGSVLPDRDDVKADAIAAEAGHPSSKPELPKERGGWGRIDPGRTSRLPRYEE